MRDLWEDTQDDNLIVREGVKALLDLESDFDIVGEAADYGELIAGAETIQPQVIVTGLVPMPDGNPITSVVPTLTRPCWPQMGKVSWPR